MGRGEADRRSLTFRPVGYRSVSRTVG